MNCKSVDSSTNCNILQNYNEKDTLLLYHNRHSTILPLIPIRQGRRTTVLAKRHYDNVSCCNCMTLMYVPYCKQPSSYKTSSDRESELKIQFNTNAMFSVYHPMKLSPKTSTCKLLLAFTHSKACVSSAIVQISVALDITCV